MFTVSASETLAEEVRGYPQFALTLRTGEFEIGLHTRFPQPEPARAPKK
jgi:hypothetical protein